MTVKFSTDKNKSAGKGSTVKKKGNGVDPAENSGTPWLKKGKAAQQALEHEDQRISDMMGPWRFYIGTKKVNEDFRISFLDGELDGDGLLALPMFYEHRLQYNGNWTTFLCTAHEGACPICMSGNNNYLAGALTICDHSPYETKEGKIIQHKRKLFIPKRKTIKLLQKYAEKKDGLTGCTFDVTRSSDKDANVGNLFDFVEKNPLKDLHESFGTKDNPMEPFDYNEVLTYHTAEELVHMGVVPAVGKVGQHGGPADEDLQKQL